MSELVVLMVPISRVLDLTVDRKDRTSKAYMDHEMALMRDVKVAGIRTPLKVIIEGDNFRVICGQTRLNAARRAGGLQEVPVTVLQGEITPARLLIEELVDNNMTSAFDPLAQAEIYLELMRINNWNQAELCANVPAAKAPAVSKALKIFSDLIESLKAKLKAGEIGPRLGYALARVDKECQLAVYEQVKGMPKVQSAEEHISELLNGKPKKKEQRGKAQDGGAQIDYPVAADWEFFAALGAKLTKVAALGKKGLLPPSLALQSLLKAS
jgi:ParB-like chromosome segregation protein Spo0J